MDPRDRRNAPWNERGPEKAPVCLLCEKSGDEATYGVDPPDGTAGGDDGQAYCEKHEYLDPDDWKWIQI